MNRRLQPPPLPLLLLLSSSLALYTWSTLSSRSTFHYWASPFTIGKHDRVLIGIGHGDLYLAYGWPSQGPSENGLPQSEPIFGSEAYEGEPVDLAPGEATELATQQFSMKIDGVFHTDSFRITRIGLPYLLAPAIAITTAWAIPPLWRRFRPRPREAPSP